MSGVILYPKSIAGKTKTMTRNLENLRETVEKEKRILQTAVESNEQLTGQAWGGVLDYAREVQLPVLEVFQNWIREQREANSEYGREAAKLPQMTLDYEDLVSDIDLYERYLDYERNEEFPSYSAIAYYKLIIGNLRRKKEAMEDFIRATKHLYERPLQVLRILRKAEVELGKVAYRPGERSLDYEGISGEWLLDLRETAGVEYLLTQGLTEVEIGNLDDMEFTPGVIRQVYELTQTAGDRELVTGLLRRDYERAFCSKSGEITPATEMFLSEYVLRISMKEDSVSELERIFNAILRPEHRKDALGIEYIENQNARNYLGKLYAGTTTILEIESILLHSPESLKEEAYGELLERNENLIALGTLSGSQYEQLERALEVSGQFGEHRVRLETAKMEGLVYIESTNSYSYEFLYAGDEIDYGEDGAPIGSEAVSGRLSLKTSILETQNDVRHVLTQESFAKLEEEKESLREQLLEELLEGSGLTGLTAVNPLLGAGVGVIYSLIKEDMGGAYNAGVKGIKASELMKEEAVKRIFTNPAMEIPGKILSAGQKYLKKSHEIDEETARKEWELEMLWFGAGGAYRVDDGPDQLVVSGIYNPEVIALRHEWEEIGMEGLMGRTGVFEPLTKNDNKELLKKLKENPDAKLVWTGKDEEGNRVLDMDIKRLDQAAYDFNKIYQEVTEINPDIQRLLLPPPTHDGNPGGAE